MAERPTDQHITYQLEYRRCGRPSCRTCRMGPGHGPYWYAYWRKGSQVYSLFIGTVHPASLDTAMESSARESTVETGADGALEEPNLGDDISQE
jgi:hypothetical protein